MPLLSHISRTRYLKMWEPSEQIPFCFMFARRRTYLLDNHVYVCKIRDFLELFFSVHPRALCRNRLHPEQIKDRRISLLSRSTLIRNFIQSSDLKDSLFAALTPVRGRFVTERRQSVSRYWMCSSMLLAWSEIHNVDLYYKGPITNCPSTLNCPATTSG